MPTQGGSIRLFRVAGIEVFLHFSWFIFAAYELTQRLNNYHSPIYAVYEYLALFGIVLLHEFGHALACRQVGGSADHIVLWPLGGVAFVLWSIAAGPLVNVALLPVLGLLWIFARQAGWAEDAPDTIRLIGVIFGINCVVLVFNMLPVYPLDGGQIVRALLWFRLGEIRSLQVASMIGLVGSVPLGGLLLWLGVSAFWAAVIVFFLLSRSLAGWQYAKAMVTEKEAAEGPPITPQP
jgi:Zn-dependent protease